MTAEVLALLVRHALTASGTLIAVKYGLSGETVATVAGSAAAFAGLAWSVADKKGRRR